MKSNLTTDSLTLEVELVNYGLQTDMHFCKILYQDRHMLIYFCSVYAYLWAKMAQLSSCNIDYHIKTLKCLLSRPLQNKFVDPSSKK